MYTYNCFDKIPSNFHICHNCGVLACVNIDHLYLHNNLNTLKRHYRKEDNKWRKKVLQRNSYICQICTSKKWLEAHHLNSFNWAKEQRNDIDNGITLCYYCHRDFHVQNGWGNNTKEQFYQFKENYNYINRNEEHTKPYHRISKFTDDDIIEIYNMRKSGYSLKEICKKYRCSPGFASSIYSGHVRHNKSLDYKLVNQQKTKEKKIPKVLLTDSQIVEITCLFDNYIPQHKIAKQFNTTVSIVSSIVNYRTYFNVSRICRRYVDRTKNDSKSLDKALNNPSLLIANKVVIEELKKPFPTIAELEARWYAEQIKKFPGQVSGGPS